MRFFVENRYDNASDRLIGYDKPKEITLEELKKERRELMLVVTDVDVNRERLYFKHISPDEL